MKKMVNPGRIRCFASTLVYFQVKLRFFQHRKVSKTASKYSLLFLIIFRILKRLGNAIEIDLSYDKI